MPHKHRRDKQVQHDDYNLPPSTHARPLATGKQVSIFSKNDSAAKKSKKRKGPIDDTPWAFKHLMRLQATGKGVSGLDNGDPRPSKKRKRGEDKPATSSATTTHRTAMNSDGKQNTTKLPSEQSQPKAQQTLPPPSQETPKILPGESLSSFSARVNQALPLSGLTQKSKALEIDGKVLREGRRTKHEKKLRRLQKGWREEEARIREKEEEEREMEEEKRDEERALWGVDVASGDLPGSKVKKGKKRDRLGKVEDDPWDVLKKKRGQPTALSDVAQEPPKFGKLPREKFKVVGGGPGNRSSSSKTGREVDLDSFGAGVGGGEARVDVGDVPNLSGSLRRREELGVARREVIERYREMMRGRSGLVT